MNNKLKDLIKSCDRLMIYLDNFDLKKIRFNKDYSNYKLFEAEAISKLINNKDEYSELTYIGKGKLNYIRWIIKDTHYDNFDDHSNIDVDIKIECDINLLNIIYNLLTIMTKEKIRKNFEQGEKKKQEIFLEEKIEKYFYNNFI